MTIRIRKQDALELLERVVETDGRETRSTKCNYAAPCIVGRAFQFIGLVNESLAALDALYESAVDADVPSWLRDNEDIILTPAAIRVLARAQEVQDSVVFDDTGLNYTYESWGAALDAAREV